MVPIIFKRAQRGIDAPTELTEGLSDHKDVLIQQITGAWVCLGAGHYIGVTCLDGSLYASTPSGAMWHHLVCSTARHADTAEEELQIIASTQIKIIKNHVLAIGEGTFLDML